MAITEEQLIVWTKPLSTTEDNKCKNAVNQVTTAIRAKFGSDVSIFLQGSYQNNTNIKQDSDVDIVVRHDGFFYPDLVFLNEQDQLTYNQNRNTSDYTFGMLKNDVQQALFDAFGASVKRKNKCILVLANSTRINADVVPCFVNKRLATLTTTDANGIKFFSDTNEAIVSYPEQHYENGVTKNAQTGRMYKRVVRILKNFKSILVERGDIEEDLVSSFLIECLVYNVPNKNFIVNDYQQTLRNIITVIYNDMGDKGRADTYLEVSKCLFLFKGGSRPPENAKLFMLKCWQYGGF